METAEILNKAADTIEERGLARETFIDSAERVCAIGAIRLVCGAQIVSNPGGFYLNIYHDEMDAVGVYRARTALENYLNETGLKDRNELIYDWNDRNTSEMVVSIMREAAESIAGRSNV